MGDQPITRPLPNTNRINTDIHDMSRIQTQDPSVRAGDDSSSLRLMATVIVSKEAVSVLQATDFSHSGQT
jgi:hypothetical protein